MKISGVILCSAILLFSTVSLASGDRATDERRIAGVFEALTDAWRSRDGESWGKQFADDADFTVWFGLELKGKDDIASGHQFVFDKVYPHEVFELEVRQIRFLDPDSAVVHLRGFVTKRGEATAERPDAVPVAVVQRAEDQWKIVAFQNTPFVVPELQDSMPLGELRKILAEYSAER